MGIKITDPVNLVITSDPNTVSTASATFDTRLFIFDKRGKPVLYNDDTSPSALPFASTLTSVTTDGSGFNLAQGGEYILVVGGFSDNSFDNVGNNLFNQGNSLVNTVNPVAGRFDSWENNNPAIGDYTLALQGVGHCQDKLDIVGLTFGPTSSSLCTGDGNGGIDSCNLASSPSAKNTITTGYINQDAFVDVVFDAFNNKPTICLGNGNAGFSSCTELNPGTNFTEVSALADINNDGSTDIVLITVNNVLIYSCLGNGDGSFQACNSFPNTASSRSDVKLALMDEDQFLDLVIAADDKIQICKGDGFGGFTTCIDTFVINAFKISLADINGDNVVDIIAAASLGSNSICINDGTSAINCTALNDDNNAREVATGDLDADGDQDIVFSSSLMKNRVCLNNGVAVFTCTDVSDSTGIYQYFAVELGLMNNDEHLDAVFAGRDIVNGGDFTRICLGNGDGTFANCTNDLSNPIVSLELAEFGDEPVNATFSVDPNAGIVLEGNDLVVFVSLDSSVDFDLVVNFEITGDVEAIDFNPAILSDSFTIPVGFVGTGFFELPTVADNIVEGLENFTVTFSLDTPGIVATGNMVATGAISESDLIFSDGFEPGVSTL